MLPLMAIAQNTKTITGVVIGENKLTPKQQADIMAILAKYGPTEGIAFDHYEKNWDFDG